MSTRDWNTLRRSWSIIKDGLPFVIVVVLLFAISSEGVGAQAAATGHGSTKATDRSGTKAEPALPMTEANDAEPIADPNVYHIGLDDQLMISVWREPELSMSVVVRPDGIITLPLLNEVKVAGLKPSELQLVLTERLKPFVSEPQVTVIVQGIRSRKVYLVGNVLKQGAVGLEGGETALQLLAAAGGVSPFAKADSIYILRTQNKKQVRIPFQYKKALKGRTNDDVLLQPGDVIVVP